MYNQKPLLGTLPNYAHPLTPNVAAWIMNEGSGNKVFDIIGGNHGTFGAGAAAPSWIPGGLHFDGDDYILNSVSDFRSSDSSGTIAAWIKTSYTGAWQNIFSSADEATELYYFGLRVRPTTGLINVAQRNNDTVDSVNGNTNIADGEWHCIVLTSNGGAWALYVDGNAESLSIVSGSNTGDWFSDTSNRDNWCIGAIKRPSISYYFNGIISEIEIYNRTINISEIGQLYIDPYCWLAEPMEAELMYAAPPVGAIINQFQKANLGADLYDGVLIT